MREEAKKNKVMSEVLRLVAPGTVVRQGLDNVLGAKTGGLIVMGYDEDVDELVDGGFYINSPFTPAHLYELAKMDGAIVLSNDGKRILYANAQLVPSLTIPSTETGIRHRTAQRTAIQTGKLVVSISQRRNVITLYKGNFRYTLQDIGMILTKANQAVQTLEKYKSVLDQAMTNLSALEFEELVTLHEVVLVLQRVEMVLRIKREVETFIHELGTEGRLVSMQLEELVANVEEEAEMLVKDYGHEAQVAAPHKVFNELKKLSADELLDPIHCVRSLGFVGTVNIQEESVSPRGYRLLQRIPRLPASIIQKLVFRFEKLSSVVNATYEELDEVEGIGEARARSIKEGLQRIQEQVFIDRHI